MRNVLGAIAGIATAFITVFVLQFVGHMVYPVPEGLDPNDTEALATYVAGLPIGALLFVLASYVIAAFDGTFIACLIGRLKPILYALIVGVLMLAATAANLIMIPHPMWFSASALLGIILAVWLASVFAEKTLHRRVDTE